MPGIAPDQQGQVSSMMDPIVATLNSAVSDLASRASSVNAAAASIGWALLGPIGMAINAVTSPTDDARAAISSALNTMRNIVTRLDGLSRQAVMDGTETIEQWTDAANTVQEGLSGLSKQLDAESVWAVELDNTKMQIDALAKFVAPYAKLAAFGVGGILLVGGLILAAHFLGGSNRTVIIRES